MFPLESPGTQKKRISSQDSATPGHSCVSHQPTDQQDHKFPPGGLNQPRRRREKNKLCLVGSNTAIPLKLLGWTVPDNVAGSVKVLGFVLCFFFCVLWQCEVHRRKQYRRSVVSRKIELKIGVDCAGAIGVGVVPGWVGVCKGEKRGKH